MAFPSVLAGLTGAETGWHWPAGSMNRSWGCWQHAEPGGFWPSDWGLRPDEEDEALSIAERHVRGWPRLIPIFSHRFSIGGARSGSPVLSASGTDVVEYGPNIASYVSIEFGLEPPALPQLGPSRPTTVSIHG